MGSYHETLAKKRAEEFQERLRRDEERMHPVFRLRFDGKSLSLNENGKPLQTWPAISGDPKFQEPKHQARKDKGPIPQGRYRMKVDEIQDLGLLDEAIGTIASPIFKAVADKKLGGWHGGRSAWGRHRAWLTPAPGTRAQGRDGFSIHGGWFPGSAGCIDLTSEIDDFTEVMRALPHKEVDVEVDYGWQGDANHRPVWPSRGRP
jgi:hypothetical protein